MQRFQTTILIVLGIFLLFKGGIGAQAQQVLPKKFIEYGWDVPTPSVVKQTIQSMEEKPFDGVVMNLEAGKQVFLQQPYPTEKFTLEINTLQTIPFTQFTDNFILLWATADAGWDWFSESDWTSAEQNIRLFAQSVESCQCAGIVFDPEPYEPYGANPWFYPSLVHSGEKSFEEYQQQVRKRGAAFMQILQQELPAVKVLALFQLSYLADLLEAPSTEQRLHQLGSHFYGLLPAFLDGMLDVAKTNSVIIDGNEGAYYYSTQDDFLTTHRTIKERLSILVDRHNHEKYVRQVKVGQAVYIDHLFALRQPQASFLSHYLTPEERAQWLEHNTYYSLSTTDEYVWCYSEQMNWWTNTIPTGVEEAIRLARQKIQNGEALGFSIRGLMRVARARQHSMS
jgi:hypothetical protein